MGTKDMREFKETLGKKIHSSSNVFIIGHNGPDFDSIGSAIGLQVLASSLGKDAYIIVNDEETKIESGVKKIIDENRLIYNFIKKKDFEELKKKDSLVIITDVNKNYMVCISEELNTVGDVMIIDHHSEDENTIETNYKWIDLSSSSACEIVTRLLGFFRIHYTEDVANFLLAGISLDTKRFKQNTTSKTHDVAEKLIDKGADIDYVNNLFLEEFESFCRISSLIINGTIIKKYSEDTLAPIQVSFTLNRNNPKGIYLKEDYAKAADRMMKFIGIDASFALGYVDEDTIHISARSGKKVNVGKIMEQMHGGGTAQSAGGKVKSEDILKIEEELMEKIPIGISDKEAIIEEPMIIKMKQMKRKF